MPMYDFNAPRLYVPSSLTAQTPFDLDRAQANYLLNVLRLKDGDAVLVFNGRDGEWRCEIAVHGRKKASLSPGVQVRAQPAAYDLVYGFAPLKQARLDYMVQKAVEMGAGVLQPVITEFTQVRKVSLERMHANAVEAAEQCGILNIPQINETVSLEQFAHDRSSHPMIFCDEAERKVHPVAQLTAIGTGPKSLLIGPEGGFSAVEREMLRSLHNVCTISLGPRILRADTAAVAALSLVQACCGDWTLDESAPGD